MQIQTAFNLSRKGLMAMGYAADLAGRLPESELVVVCRAGDDPERVRKFLNGQIARSATMTLRLYDENSARQPVLTDTILVSHQATRPTAAAHVLYTVDERRIRNGQVRVCFPFGSGTTGPYDAALAYLLAQKLKAEIVLAHTTWRNPECASERASDHMHRGAVEVLERLTAEAEKYGLKTMVHIATAEDVPRFIVETANDLGCQLIVMARRHQTLRGGYVDEVMRLTNVPVLSIKGVG